MSTQHQHHNHHHHHHHHQHHNPLGNPSGVHHHQTSNNHHILSVASEDHLIGNLTDTTTSEHSELIDHTFNQLSDLFFPNDSNQSLLSPSLEHTPSRDTDSTGQHHHHHQHNQLQDLHSSCETLVGSSEDITSSIENLTKLTCLREKRLSSIPEQHTASTPNSEQDHSSLCFDRSTPQEIGLLSLRSSSDPAIALHTLQERQALQQQQQQSAHHIGHTRSGGDPLLSPLGGPLSLPSFQETYSLKYGSSSNSDSLTTELTIKMDEDCYPLTTSTEAIGGPALNQHATSNNSNQSVASHHAGTQHHQHSHIHSQLQNQHNLAASHQHLQQPQQSSTGFSYHGHFNATTTPASSNSSASSYEFNNGSSSGNENVHNFNAAAAAAGESFYQQYQLTQPNVSISFKKPTLKFFPGRVS